MPRITVDTLASHATLLASVREWLESGLQEAGILDGYVGAEWTGDGLQPPSIALSQGNITYSQDIIGRDIISAQISILCQTPYGADLMTNLKSGEFVTSISNWIKEADKAGNFPVIEDFDVDKISVQNGTVISVSDMIATYHISMTIHGEQNI